MNRPDEIKPADPALFREVSSRIARMLESGIVKLVFKTSSDKTRIMRATRQGMSPWIWDGTSLYMAVRDLAIDEIRSFRLDRLISIEESR